MAVQPGPTFKRYAANGAATVYTIPFLLLDPANLQITLNGVAVTSGFTLAGLGNASSSCTFGVAPTGDLLFQQVMQFQRLTDYQMNGDFLSQTVNGDYDRLWLAIKQLNRDDGRALSVSPLEPEGIPALPVKALRNLRLLAFDAEGNPAPSNLTLEQLEQQPALALESAAAAQGFAGEASASANVAGNFAEHAVGMADTAGEYAHAAAGSASFAVAASEAIQLSTGIFESIAAGLAFTATDGYFSVPSANSAEYLILYRNVLGVAVPIKRYPSTANVPTVFEENTDSAIAFTDLSGKLLGEFNRDGLLDASPTPAMKARTNYLELLTAPGMLIGATDPENRVVWGFGNDGKSLVDIESPSIEIISDALGFPLLVLDGERKVIFGIDAEGKQIPEQLNQAAAPVINYSDALLDAYPIKRHNNLPQFESLSLIKNRMVLPSIAVGRTVDGVAPQVPLADSGYTHPKVLYLPGGWNGYEYWMAITPYRGPLTGLNDMAQYENPHVFCSLDGVTWVEPAGIHNPLDVPPPAPSLDYWSDTHIALGSDGYLHLWYRGNGAGYGGRGVVHRKSRDGVNWSARKDIYSTASLSSVDTTNLLLSPAFLQNGGSWLCFDAVRTSPTGLVIPPQKNQTYTFVFRRDDTKPDGSYGEYGTSQIINFTNMPWGEPNDVWHLDACKFGNLWVLLLNVGPDNSSGAAMLYVAYSTDGWNFTVDETVLFANNSYRSSIVPKGEADGVLTFLVYQSALDGTTNLYELKSRIK